jgi:predicted nucleic acid-binding Zn ribbon protein
MPTYVYETVRPDGNPGERFEVIQKMTDEPLSTHPETGEPVRRVFLPFGIAGPVSPWKTDRALNDDRKLERLGFTKYVKSADGRYDKVVGQGPDLLQR